MPPPTIDTHITDLAGPSDDARLVARCQAGDMAAFDVLVTRHRAKVYATVFSLTRNEQDAWDLAQETFVKAWRNMGRFRGQSSVFTWLYRIATNLALDWLRRRQVESGVEFDDTLGMPAVDAAAVTAPKADPLPHRQLEARELRARIDAAIAQLSPEHQAVILLREIDGRSYEEIAEATGASEGTVMSRLFYARKKLQLLLQDVYENL